jgi:hypothetical protein
MSTLTVEIWIEALPARVFEVVTDLARLPERVDAIRKVEILSDGPVGLGTSFRETRVMFGKEATEVMEFTKFDPPRGYVLEAESHGSHYTTFHDLTPENGGTRLSLTFETRAISLMAKILSVTLMPLCRGAMRKALLGDMESLKTVAESTPS